VVDERCGSGAEELTGQENFFSIALSIVVARISARGHTLGMNNAAIKSAVEGLAGIIIRTQGKKLPAAQAQAVAEMAAELGVSKKVIIEAWRAEA